MNNRHWCLIWFVHNGVTQSRTTLRHLSPRSLNGSRLCGDSPRSGTSANVTGRTHGRFLCSHSPRVRKFVRNFPRRRTGKTSRCISRRPMRPMEMSTTLPSGRILASLRQVNQICCCEMCAMRSRRCLRIANSRAEQCGGMSGSCSRSGRGCGCGDD